MRLRVYSDTAVSSPVTSRQGIQNGHAVSAKDFRKQRRFPSISTVVFVSSILLNTTWQALKRTLGQVGLLLCTIPPYVRCDARGQIGRYLHKGNAAVVTAIVAQPKPGRAEIRRPLLQVSLVFTVLPMSLYLSRPVIGGRNSALLNTALIRTSAASFEARSSYLVGYNNGAVVACAFI